MYHVTLAQGGIRYSTLLLIYLGDVEGRGASYSLYSDDRDDRRIF